MGLAALRLQMVTDYARYEDARAADVLPALSGREAFEAVWRPLLEAKFGSHWQSHLDGLVLEPGSRQGPGRGRAVRCAKCSATSTAASSN